MKSKTRYAYPENKLRDRFEKQLKHIRDMADGYHIRIRDISRSEDGVYDEKKLRDFLDEFVDSYNDDPQEIPLCDLQREYVKSFLYVVIRSVQADLRCVLVKDADYPFVPVRDDRFFSLLEHIRKTNDYEHIVTPDPEYGSLAVRQGRYENNIPVSFALYETIRSLYFFLTGEEDGYLPGPYYSPDEYLKRIYGDLVEAEEEKAAQQESRSGEETQSCESATKKDLWTEWVRKNKKEYEKYIRDVDYLRELKPSEIGEALFPYETENGDLIPVSWTGDPEFKNDEEFSRQQKEKEQCCRIYDPEKPENRAILEKETKRIRRTFSCTEEFIREFKHLQELTEKTKETEWRYCTGNMQCYPVVSDLLRVINTDIKKMTDYYLRTHGYTLYTDGEAFMKVFHMLRKSADEIRED